MSKKEHSSADGSNAVLLHWNAQSTTHGIPFCSASSAAFDPATDDREAHERLKADANISSRISFSNASISSLLIIVAETRVWITGYMANRKADGRNRLLSVFREFLESEASGGLLLMGAAAAALAVANSPLSDLYFQSLHACFLGLSVGHWINDGLMAVFFLLVGLENKRHSPAA
ncbi:Na+/H+ antiporter NhaA [Azospirillum melinis]|uniref:Na+/H+ antiporter NhaA n=1 Tax=Azospirillum melinis TaxID=328839 RepID=UPI00375779C6